MYSFVSVFAEKLDAMMQFRTARGYKPDTYLRHYIKFDKHCNLLSCENSHLTMDLVLGWLESDQSHELASRATAIRMFGKYLDAIGEIAYILPNKYAIGGKPSSPYIFTDDELTALFYEIDRLKPTMNEPFISEIAPVLFRLTYTCGLRPNESRDLLRDNVNLDTGEILITDTKHNKERLVVMSDDMLDMSRRYEFRRCVFSCGSPFFFPSNDGGPIKREKVYSTLGKAWRAARRGFSPSSARTVRVYDLRHRFASACLNRWLDCGENLMAMLPYLRTYMGHGTLNETAYYIHILPENIINSTAIDWGLFNSILPEVDVCID